MLNKCFSMLGDVIVNKAAHGFVPCHPETLRDPCADKVVPLKLLQISETAFILMQPFIPYDVGSYLYKYII